MTYRIAFSRKIRRQLVWHVMDEERMVEVEYIGLKTPDLYERLGLGRRQAE